MKACAEGNYSMVHIIVSHRAILDLKSKVWLRNKTYCHCVHYLCKLWLVTTIYWHVIG